MRLYEYDVNYVRWRWWMLFLLLIRVQSILKRPDTNREFAITHGVYRTRLDLSLSIGSDIGRSAGKGFYKYT